MLESRVRDYALPRFVVTPKPPASFHSHDFLSDRARNLLGDLDYRTSAGSYHNRTHMELEGYFLHLVDYADSQNEAACVTRVESRSD